MSVTLRTAPIATGRHEQVAGHHPSGHDLRPVENVMDSWLLSTGVDALGIPDQSQSDRMVGADRIACGGCRAPQPRAQASAPRLNAMRYLCASRSQPTDRRESAILKSACTHPGKTPALRAGWKPNRHGPPCWIRYRWRPPESLTRSLVGCRTPVSDELTPKSLFHQALSQSDRLARPHGVM